VKGPGAPKDLKNQIKNDPPLVFDEDQCAEATWLKARGGVFDTEVRGAFLLFTFHLSLLTHPISCFRVRACYERFCF
jgi:hypothetical protein